MAGQFELLFTQSFSAVPIVTVTHNLNRAQVAVLARIGNVARNDLISSITPDPADPRNAVIVTFGSPQTGDILIIDTDYVFANIPTSENAAVLSGGAPLLETLADVKGDLLVATSADTVARLAAGTDTHVLTADSTEPSGVKWAAGGGGGSTIVVEEDGSTVGGGPHDTLNFVNLLATDAGGGTANIATPAPVYVDYYDSGTTHVGSSATTLGLDTARQSNALFVLSSDTVTVQSGGAGDYAVRYDVAFRESDSSNREVECWLEINGTEVTGMRSVGSHWSEHGLVTDSVMGRSAILTLATSDVIRLRSQVTNGSSGYTTDTAGVGLQIMSIGSSGPAGPTGPF